MGYLFSEICEGEGGGWKHLFLNLSGFVTVNNAYDIAWWFVGVYVVFLALFPLLYRIGRVDPLLLGMIALAGIGLQTRVGASGIPGALLLFQAPFLVGILAARSGWFEGGIARQVAARPWRWHLALLVALFLFRFRAEGNCTFDFIIAPLFTFSAACLIRRTRTGRPLAFLGDLSLPLWLTHGFLAYTYAEKLIYAPRYPIPIFLFLLFINVPAVWAVEQFRIWVVRIVSGRLAVQLGLRT